jgi:hypothetical protein
MKLQLSKPKIYALAAILSIALFSCNKIFETTSEDVLSPDKYYKTINDANNAVLGVYSQLFDIANKYIILNEVRADLIDVTENADIDLIALNEHRVDKTNKYANPSDFYKIINNCNDVINNLKLMYKNLFITKEQFEERYSDIMAIRCWLYWQLGVHYGTVPYITKPFENFNDIKSIDNYPSYKFDQLLDTLVETMKNLPTLNNYITFPPVNLNGNNMANGGWFDKKFFMAELFLWDGQYYEAAKIYRTLIEPAPAGFDGYNWHRMCALNQYGGGTTYTFNQIFSAIPTSNLFRNEFVWVLLFDYRYNQINTFVDLFAIEGGKYLLKPSQVSIDNWSLFPSGPNYDQRGLGFSWTMQNGKPVVYKHILEYQPNSSEKPGKWWIYRQSSIHLHYAEAVNRLNHEYLAWILVNNGMPNYNLNKGVLVNNVLRSYKDTAFMQTLEPFPYDLSGLPTSITQRQTIDGYVYPSGNLLRNAGVRGRAAVSVINVPDSVNGQPVDSMLFIEDLIIDESAREIGYEGHRWPDLLRIALRRNDPNFIANRVAEKFVRKNDNATAEAVRNKLASGDWFLPLP